MVMKALSLYITNQSILGDLAYSCYLQVAANFVLLFGIYGQSWAILKRAATNLDFCPADKFSL